MNSNTKFSSYYKDFFIKFVFVFEIQSSKFITFVFVFIIRSSKFVKFNFVFVIQS